jgi:hypothetical protein
MPKIKKSLMGSHNPSEQEEKARRWCIGHNIKIYPKPTTSGVPTRWKLVLQINTKTVEAPDELGKGVIWERMYEYYMYYYKKYNK